MVLEHLNNKGGWLAGVTKDTKVSELDKMIMDCNRKIENAERKITNLMDQKNRMAANEKKKER